MRREAPPKPTAAEREVADLLPIEADPDAARAVLIGVPLLFDLPLYHRDQLYTPGVARNHRYRHLPFPDFSGMSVLDVGTFDGFDHSPKPVARGESSRWTTSSTGRGSGALGYRA